MRGIEISPPACREAGRLNVLVIDTDPLVVEMIEGAMSELPGPRYDVTTLDSVERALDAVSRDPVAGIVLNLSMQGVDPIEAIRTLQERSGGVPIVALTATEDTDLGLRAVRAGAQDYLVKERINGHVLVRVLRYATERQLLNNQVAERSAELEAANRNLSSVIDGKIDAVLVLDEAGEILFANQEAQNLFGRDKAALIGMAFGLPVIHEEFSEVRIPHSEGRLKTAEMRLVDLDWEGRRAAIASLRDVTERKRSEAQLQIAQTVFETTSEGIVVSDAEHRIIAVNPGFTRITGYQSEDVLGLDRRSLHAGPHDAAFFANMNASLEAHGFWEGEIWSRRQDGSRYAEWHSIARIRRGSQESSRFVSVFRDITQRKRSEQEIHYRANYDALTGLINRTRFMEELSHVAAVARRSGSLTALMFIDLDGFKRVNDTLGHEAGDELLRETSNRLRASVRKTDVVARLGGDEFTIILPSLSAPLHASVVGDLLLDRLSKPFVIQGQEVFIGASIGITLAPGDGDDPDTLLKNADMAMYRAKQSGRNHYQYFEPSMNVEAQERMRLEQDLRRALERRQFFIEYQPIMDLRSGSMVGAEALIRWRHPQFGRIPPETFIPLAEDTGLIVPIGDWVLRNACAAAAEWRRASGPDAPYVAVNLSSRQLRNGVSAEHLDGILRSTRLPADMLVLELTENVMVDDNNAMMGRMRELKDLGIRLAIDDFGTGYSSLSYLSRLAVNIIKIDKGFIADMESGANGGTLVEGIIALGHSLGMTAIAEGVETSQQLSALQGFQCDSAQGFHYSESLPSSEFVAWLNTRQRHAAIVS